MINKNVHLKLLQIQKDQLELEQQQKLDHRLAHQLVQQAHQLVVQAHLHLNQGQHQLLILVPQVLEVQAVQE